MAGIIKKIRNTFKDPLGQNVDFYGYKDAIEKVNKKLKRMGKEAERERRNKSSKW